MSSAREGHHECTSTLLVRGAEVDKANVVSACQAIEMIYVYSHCRLGVVQPNVIIMTFVLISMDAQHFFLLLKKEIMNAYLFC
jgi:hypothetical protein